MLKILPVTFIVLSSSSAQAQMPASTTLPQVPAAYESYLKARDICTRPDHLASKMPVTFLPQYKVTCQKVFDGMILMDAPVRAAREAGRHATETTLRLSQEATHKAAVAARAAATPLAATPSQSDDDFINNLVGTSQP